MYLQKGISKVISDYYYYYYFIIIIIYYDYNYQLILCFLLFLVVKRITAKCFFASQCHSRIEPYSRAEY